MPAKKKPSRARAQKHEQWVAAQKKRQKDIKNIAEQYKETAKNKVAELETNFQELKNQVVELKELNAQKKQELKEKEEKEKKAKEHPQTTPVKQTTTAKTTPLKQTSENKAAPVKHTPTVESQTTANLLSSLKTMHPPKDTPKEKSEVRSSSITSSTKVYSSDPEVQKIIDQVYDNQELEKKAKELGVKVPEEEEEALQPEESEEALLQELDELEQEQQEDILDKFSIISSAHEDKDQNQLLEQLNNLKDEITKEDQLEEEKLSLILKEVELLVESAKEKESQKDLGSAKKSFEQARSAALSGFTNAINYYSNKKDDKKVETLVKEQNKKLTEITKGIESINAKEQEIKRAQEETKKQEELKRKEEEVKKKAEEARKKEEEEKKRVQEEARKREEEKKRIENLQKKSTQDKRGTITAPRNIFEKKYVTLTEEQKQRAKKQRAEGQQVEISPRKIERLRQLEQEEANKQKLANKQEAKSEEALHKHTQAEVLYKKGQEAYQNKNFKDAVKFYEEALNLNHNYVDATVALGEIYRKGEGDIARDLNKARRYISQAANATPPSSKAQYILATMYEEGQGVPQHTETAKIWHDKAKVSRAEEWYKRGELEYSNNKFTIAANYFEKALADNPNHEQAALSLSHLYQKGQGVKIDLKKAHDFVEQATNASYDNWYRKKFSEKAKKSNYKLTTDYKFQKEVYIASENYKDIQLRQNEIEKEIKIEESFEQGLKASVKDDFESAFNFFQQAIEKKETKQRLSEIGISCINNKKYADGEKFLVLAADAGAPAAQVRLAEMYEKGTLSNADPMAAASKYFTKALNNPDAGFWKADAEKGLERVQKQIADSTSQKELKDKKQSPKSAEEWFVQGKNEYDDQKYNDAAKSLEEALKLKHDYTKAAALLGFIYLTCIKDANKARPLIWQAAHANPADPLSQQMLATMYEYGQGGLEKNFKLAKQWYETAYMSYQDENTYAKDNINEKIKLMAQKIEEEKAEEKTSKLNELTQIAEDETKLKHKEEEAKSGFNNIHEIIKKLQESISDQTKELKKYSNETKKQFEESKSKPEEGREEKEKKKEEAIPEIIEKMEKSIKAQKESINAHMEKFEAIKQKEIQDEERKKRKAKKYTIQDEDEQPPSVPPTSPSDQQPLPPTDQVPPPPPDRVDAMRTQLQQHLEHLKQLNTSLNDPHINFLNSPQKVAALLKAIADITAKIQQALSNPDTTQQADLNEKVEDIKTKSNQLLQASEMKIDGIPSLLWKPDLANPNAHPSLTQAQRDQFGKKNTVELFCRRIGGFYATCEHGKLHASADPRYAKEEIDSMRKTCIELWQRLNAYKEHLETKQSTTNKDVDLKLILHQIRESYIQKSIAYKDKLTWEEKEKFIDKQLESLEFKKLNLSKKEKRDLVMLATATIDLYRMLTREDMLGSNVDLSKSRTAPRFLESDVLDGSSATPVEEQVNAIFIKYGIPVSEKIDWKDEWAMVDPDKLPSKSEWASAYMQADGIPSKPPRFTHMHYDNDPGKDLTKRTHYVTVLKSEKNGAGEDRRVAEFYTNKVPLDAKRTRVGIAQWIPDDRILAWAIAQAKEFKKENPSANILEVVGTFKQFGNLSEDYKKALLLYGAYLQKYENTPAKKLTIKEPDLLYDAKGNPVKKRITFTDDQIDAVRKRIAANPVDPHDKDRYIFDQETVKKAQAHGPYTAQQLEQGTTSPVSAPRFGNGS